MNAKTLIVCIGLALGTAPGFAAEATQFAIEPSVLSRADVLAELARARAAGTIDQRGETYGSFAPAQQPAGASTQTRTAVIAELQRARAAGELRTSGETYGSFSNAEIKSTKSRADVRANTPGPGLSRGNTRDLTGG